MAVKVHAKWVIAGEHTILSGGSAIAVPHPEFSMILWQEDHPPLSFASSNFVSSVLDPSVWKGLCLIAQKYDLSKTFFQGDSKICLHSSIPIGGGLGSSAALCVGLLRLSGETDPGKIWSIGREMECFFHGQSSGMDIAAVMNASPILFSKKNGVGSYAPVFGDLSLFRFGFHDTGLRGKTSDCIQIAKYSGSVESPLRMGKAVELALQALDYSARKDSKKSHELLAESFQCSWEAYEGWGLLPPSIITQADTLKAEGALSVRLTGAGMGGFLVSLWPSEPL